ncbi:MAG: nuoF [Acidimicrobiales bacterium]|jgi:NADH-quinone oxidoreductase subunit F|nr:nuoF [Acidimicrobiales bacterium]
MSVTASQSVVFARMGDPEAHTIDRYVATGGYEGLRRALSMKPEDIEAATTASTLTGRGGAGFATGQKWSLLADAYPRYVVVNGDESEPGTFKDRQLMERDPHQVIEGALITAYAVRATRVFLYVRGEMALAQERIGQALVDAYAKGYVGSNIMGSGWSIDVVLHWGAGAYVVGEETALLESLEGKRAFPRIKPPFYPAAKGLYYQPTIVNNVETVSTLPWILRHSGEEYAALGAGRSTGTRIMCVSGHVKNPGNYEVEAGNITFRDLIYAPELGGGIRDGHTIKAFVPGGGSAPWLFEDHLDLTLDPGPVAAEGTMLGSGAVVVMDDSTCMVRAAWNLVRFYSHESCGQCTPCREGGNWMEKIMWRIENGAGRMEDLDLLLDVGQTISPGSFPHASNKATGLEATPWPYRMTTICFVGPSAVVPMHSALTRFRDEFVAHIEQGSCPVGAHA